MASAPGVTSPTDYSTQTFPFDITGTSDAAAGGVVEARGENGLLLPAVENPVPVVGGSFTIQGVSSLVGSRGATYVKGAGLARAALSASASSGGVAQAARSTSATAGGEASAPADTTAPSVTALSITPNTDTDVNLTGIAFTADEAFTGWMIIDVAAGAAAPAQPSAAAVAAAHTVAATTSLSGQTHTAGAANSRDLYLFVRDAAGNVNSVANATTYKATVTISAGATGVYVQGVFSDLAQFWLRRSGTDPSKTGYVTTGEDFEGAQSFAVTEWSAGVSQGSKTGGALVWPGYAYLRFEHDDSGGAMRVRGGNSSTGPWTTVWTGNDTTLGAGQGSSTTVGVTNPSSGTY